MIQYSSQRPNIGTLTPAGKVKRFGLNHTLLHGTNEPEDARSHMLLKFLQIPCGESGVHILPLSLVDAQVTSIKHDRFYLVEWYMMLVRIYKDANVETYLHKMAPSNIQSCVHISDLWPGDR